MSGPAVQSTQLRCHHCQNWVGEAGTPMEFQGMFKDPRERSRIPEPRDTYRCKSCGWVNVFRRADAALPSWREVSLKG